MIFSWDFGKWALQVTPYMLRRPAMNAWIQVLLLPIKNIFVRFQDHQRGTRALAMPNGQTMSLEWHLNNVFDPGDRRIFIRSANEILAPVYVFRDSEGQPLFLGSKKVRRQIEYNTTNFFIVHVPAAVNNNRIAFEINRYKTAGTTYSIKLI